MRGSDLSAYSTYRWIMNAPDLPAGRRRGVNFQERSVHAASTRHLPTPLLFASVVGSLGVLFVLAVIGAYALIRAVLGSD